MATYRTTPQGLQVVTTGNPDVPRDIGILADSIDTQLAADRARLTLAEKHEVKRAVWAGGTSWAAGEIKTYSWALSRTYSVTPSAQATIATMPGGSIQLQARVNCSATSATLYVFNPASTPTTLGQELQVTVTILPA